MESEFEVQRKMKRLGKGSISTNTNTNDNITTDDNFNNNNNNNSKVINNFRASRIGNFIKKSLSTNELIYNSDHESYFFKEEDKEKELKINLLIQMEMKDNDKKNLIVYTLDLKVLDSLKIYEVISMAVCKFNDLFIEKNISIRLKEFNTNANYFSDSENEGNNDDENNIDKNYWLKLSKKNGYPKNDCPSKNFYLFFKLFFSLIFPLIIFYFY